MGKGGREGGRAAAAATATGNPTNKESISSIHPLTTRQERERKRDLKHHLSTRVHRARKECFSSHGQGREGGRESSSSSDSGNITKIEKKEIKRGLCPSNQKLW